MEAGSGFDASSGADQGKLSWSKGAGSASQTLRAATADSVKIAALASIVLHY